MCVAECICSLFGAWLLALYPEMALPEHLCVIHRPNRANRTLIAFSVLRLGNAHNNQWFTVYRLIVLWFADCAVVLEFNGLQFNLANTFCDKRSHCFYTAFGQDENAYCISRSCVRTWGQCQQLSSKNARRWSNNEGGDDGNKEIGKQSSKT